MDKSKQFDPAKKNSIDSSKQSPVQGTSNLNVKPNQHGVNSSSQRTPELDRDQFEQKNPSKNLNKDRNL